MGLFDFFGSGHPSQRPVLGFELATLWLQEQFIFSGSGDARVKESPGVPQGPFLPPGRSTIVWQKLF